MLVPRPTRTIDLDDGSIESETILLVLGIVAFLGITFAIQSFMAVRGAVANRERPRTALVNGVGPVPVRRLVDT